MTIEQIEELNSSLIDLVKSYHLMIDEFTEEQIQSFSDNHPLADVLFEIETYLSKWS